MTYAILTNNTITTHGSAADLWPGTSFSVDGPNDDFLAEVGAVLIRSDAPYDPTTQTLEPCDPYVRDGEVFNTVAAPLPPPPAPAPDWARFKRVALGSDTLNSILVAAYQSVPVAAGALAPALLRAETSDAADFAAAWGAIRRALPVPLEVVAGFVAVAEQCNLPAEFVAALQPSPN
jgi:hypothetical protein